MPAIAPSPHIHNSLVAGSLLRDSSKSTDGWVHEDGLWYKRDYYRLNDEKVSPTSQGYGLHVLSNIFAGPFSLIRNDEWVRERNIERVLVLGSNSGVTVRNTLKLRIVDVNEGELEAHFESVVALLTEATNENANVLILDRDNRTYSPTVIVAYLLSLGWSMPSAVDRVQGIFNTNLSDYSLYCLNRWDQSLRQRKTDENMNLNSHLNKKIEVGFIANFTSTPSPENTLVKESVTTPRASTPVQHAESANEQHQDSHEHAFQHQQRHHHDSLHSDNHQYDYHQHQNQQVVHQHPEMHIQHDSHHNSDLHEHRAQPHEQNGEHKMEQQTRHPPEYNHVEMNGHLQHTSEHHEQHGEHQHHHHQSHLSQHVSFQVPPPPYQQQPHPVPLRQRPGKPEEIMLPPRTVMTSITVNSMQEAPAISTASLVNPAYKMVHPQVKPLMSPTSPGPLIREASLTNPMWTTSPVPSVAPWNSGSTPIPVQNHSTPINVKSSSSWNSSSGNPLLGDSLASYLGNSRWADNSAWTPAPVQHPHWAGTSGVERNGTRWSYSTTTSGSSTPPPPQMSHVVESTNPIGKYTLPTSDRPARRMSVPLSVARPQRRTTFDDTDAINRQRALSQHRVRGTRIPIQGQRYRYVREGSSAFG